MGIAASKQRKKKNKIDVNPPLIKPVVKQADDDIFDLTPIPLRFDLEPIPQQPVEQQQIQLPLIVNHGEFFDYIDLPYGFYRPQLKNPTMILALDFDETLATYVKQADGTYKVTYLFEHAWRQILEFTYQNNIMVFITTLRFTQHLYIKYCPVGPVLDHIGRKYFSGIYFSAKNSKTNFPKRFALQQLCNRFFEGDTTEIVFVDDKDENIADVKTVGIRAIQVDANGDFFQELSLSIGMGKVQLVPPTPPQARVMIAANQRLFNQPKWDMHEHFSAISLWPERKVELANRVLILDVELVGKLDSDSDISDLRKNLVLAQTRGISIVLLGYSNLHLKAIDDRAYLLAMVTKINRALFDCVVITEKVYKVLALEHIQAKISPKKPIGFLTDKQADLNFAFFGCEILHIKSNKDFNKALSEYISRDVATLSCRI